MEWTQAKIDYALNHEGLMPNEEIARRLGTTRRALEAKIDRVKGPARKQYERQQLGRSVSRSTLGPTAQERAGA